MTAVIPSSRRHRRFRELRPPFRGSGADIPDREAILRVLDDCPEELAELRATLLQEHVWRKREGL